MPGGRTATGESCERRKDLLAVRHRFEPLFGVFPWLLIVACWMPQAAPVFNLTCNHWMPVSWAGVAARGNEEQQNLRGICAVRRGGGGQDFGGRRREHMDSASENLNAKRLALAKGRLQKVSKTKRRFFLGVLRCAGPSLTWKHLSESQSPVWTLIGNAVYRYPPQIHFVFDSMGELARSVNASRDQPFPPSYANRTMAGGLDGRAFIDPPIPHPHRSDVSDRHLMSGVTMVAICPRRRRPMTFVLRASRIRWASVKRLGLPPSCSRRTRFSSLEVFDDGLLMPIYPAGDGDE